MNLGLCAVDIRVRFAKVWPEFNELGKAGQKLWLYLWEETRFGSQEIRITDREIAQACGRGLRWAQKALSQLLGFTPEGCDQPVPAVAKERKYGPRKIAGRILRLIVPFAEPKEEAKDAKPKSKSKGAAKPPPAQPCAAPVPIVEPPEPTGPRRKLGEPPSPEELAAGQSAAAAIRAELAKARAAEPPKAPRRLDPTVRKVEADQTRKEATRARLNALAERHRAMAAAGDKVALAELEAVERALRELDGPEGPARE